MKIRIFVCPFAQFGNPGTQAGAQLLADAVREILSDAESERRHHRARALSKNVTIDELPLLTPNDLVRWRESASQAASRALKHGEFLIWIGGNHLSVQPLYEELGRSAGSLVVQADAHLDIYHHGDVIRDLSHGNFVRFLDPAPAIVNVGHRDLFLPARQIRRYFQEAYSASDFVVSEATVLASVAERVAAADRIWLDVDWDALDPASFPGVVDALPFGLSPQQLLKLLDVCWTGKLAGISFSEFDPARDRADRSLGLAAWLIELILLRVIEAQ